MPKKSKTAPSKPSRGLGAALEQLQLDDNKKLPAVEGSGIDAGLEAFDLFDHKNIKLDQHPERRRGQAFAAFSDRREKELKDEGSRLNFTQRRQLLHEEFKKSPENPLNQAYVNYNATQEERQAALHAEVEKKEAYLTAK